MTWKHSKPGPRTVICRAGRFRVGPDGVLDPQPTPEQARSLAFTRGFVQPSGGPRADKPLQDNPKDQPEPKPARKRRKSAKDKANKPPQGKPEATGEPSAKKPLLADVEPKPSGAIKGEGAPRSAPKPDPAPEQGPLPLPEPAEAKAEAPPKE